MDEIESYTDMLRRTYRQSLDVILPFTNHEAVVYCNDHEFETYLEKNHSVKDLQACIYLLERHIDLQQEVIQGLTRLQEVHKLDENPSEYNIITDKLLSAQNKLAVLRSRTVRCLTKQIQQRCDDSSMMLPEWSENPGTKYTNELNNHTPDKIGSNEIITPKAQASSKETTSILNSENINDNMYKQLNGCESEKKCSKKTEIVLEENDQTQFNEGEVFSTENVMYEKNEEEEVNSIFSKDCPTECMEKEKVLENKEGPTTVRDDFTDNFTSESSQQYDKTDNVTKASTLEPRNPDNDKMNDGFVSNSESPHSNGVQLFLNVSNVGPSEVYGNRESQRISSRHIIEPVEEKITVEVLQSQSSGIHNEGVEEEGLALKSEYDYVDALSTVSSDSDESSSSHSAMMRTMNWDPSLLVRKILGKVKPISTEKIENVDDEVMHMAGYLEKLPVNQKKATILRSWRKRYFKLLHGKLFYFEDHRAASPISFIKLGGSQVVEIGSKCLEVTEDEDMGGKCLVIRCGSWPELQDWRKALENEAKTKVKRQHFELVQEKKSVIIIDFGSSSIKAGFLEDQAWPQVIVPSVYAVKKDDKKRKFYGYDALNPLVRNICKLVYPLRSPLTIGKYLLDPNDLIGFLEIIFKELRVDPSHYQILMTTPVNLRDQDKERLVEILFDEFQVASVYMKCQAILSLYSYSATSGIIVNVGDNIDVVPVEEGYIVEPGMNSLPYGGRQVTDHFSRLMSSSGYRYFSEVECYIAEYLKVKTGYVSQDFSKETEEFSESDCLTVDMSEFDLPSGDKLVTVAKERFTAFEGFFKPELWGKDSPGLPDMVYGAVMACSIDNRKELCRNIFLSGAATKSPGFAERLKTELSRKFHSSLLIQVHASPDRQFASFIGAAVLASLENFDDLCISREDWEETGPELLKKWDGV